MNRGKAVVLLSGGLDSVTVAHYVKNELQFDICAITFLYGQMNAAEIEFAKFNAHKLDVFEHIFVTLDISHISYSSLIDSALPLPLDREVSDIERQNVPSTYVPARNMIFLSHAACYAETIKSYDIFIGVNSVDYSGYPDCRSGFITAFQNAINQGCNLYANGKKPLRVHAPLARYSKADIVKLGLKNGVDYSMTLSCYRPLVKESIEPRQLSVTNCGRCDACRLRDIGMTANNLQGGSRTVMIAL
ncbi:7-cyano-7-deazaguanine synthase [Candidatus Fokinia solitaria]|uniref:7-cyano-7-deazaguanine synthase n=1 Tax=Candidatus Fokinia solitaria TaxID=1802984 RepID=A0A2U8BSL7_9RICK|nr:7-cyano-7-deazaguanine synthase QueC [Candidatus Fokinia solitaria]AWD33332.1 7-cyano-7-deazaguanine synthase [Candidatus Fokinia solitaria]